MSPKLSLQTRSLADVATAFIAGIAVITGIVMIARKSPHTGSCVRDGLPCRWPPSDVTLIHGWGWAVLALGLLGLACAVVASSADVRTM